VFDAVALDMKVDVGVWYEANSGGTAFKKRCVTVGGSQANGNICMR